jgi:RimJ/RimL family protein N-acetyltransferase
MVVVSPSFLYFVDIMKPLDDYLVVEKTTIRNLREEDFSALFEMYISFQPKSYMLGLPPTVEPVCAKWLGTLLLEKLNLIAVFGEHIIGHSSLVDVPRSDVCELIIFVHQDFRGQGVGTALLKETCRRSFNLCKNRIWLMVSCSNTAAIAVYYKCGFRVTGMYGDVYEMELDLESCIDYMSK